jgi:hypothetical protein
VKGLEKEVLFEISEILDLVEGESIELLLLSYGL